MTKIKILVITLLLIVAIANVFFSVIPSWLGVVLSMLSLMAFVLLNTEVFRIRGLIRKLIVWADIIIAIAFILFFTPATLINLVVTNYLILSLSMIFEGLLVVILVRAYNPEIK